MTSTDIGVSEEPAPGAGLSLQLTGAGSSAADFTWTAGAADSFGSVNAGQSFLSTTGTGHLRVDDARVAEGDSGTSNLVFTVHRAGGTALSATVDYAVNLDGTANARRSRDRRGAGRHAHLCAGRVFASRSSSR